MRVLAIETATQACSAALLVGDALLERFEIAPRGHAQRILAMVEELLAEAGLAPGALDAIAFGRGPGAFTGVRVAASVTQGLAFGAGLPVVPVSTLQALAAGVRRRTGHDAVLAALDARMGEVYWGAYRAAGDAASMALVGAERVAAPAAVPPPPGHGWFGAGSGFERHGPALAACLGAALAGVVTDALPRAADVAAIGGERLRAGEARPPEEAVPVYLRDEVVTPSPAGER